MILEAYPRPERYVDIRATATQVHHGQRAFQRDWKSITAIVLHQAAGDLGENPPRYNTLAAHVGITRAGTFVHVHDFDKNVAHANRFNAKTVGVEFSGLYSGLVDDPTTAPNEALQTTWDNPATPKREMPQIFPRTAHEAGVAGCLWICSEVARHGGRVRHILAHRQSSAMRRSDPGQEPWQVAIEVMALLGLSDGGDGFRVDDGLPIPRQWDKARTGKY